MRANSNTANGRRTTGGQSLTHNLPMMSDGGQNPDTQEEYLDLQRRYKNVENDRKAYNDETQAQLKKQKNMIDKLQKEN